MTSLLEFRATSELIITSERLTPEEIGARVGMPCDRCWSAGDLRGKTGKKWTTSGWVLRSSASGGSRGASDLFSTSLRDLAERLRPIVKKVRDLSAESDIGLSVDVVASDVPGLTLDREVLRVIADVGAWLDIDITISAAPAGAPSPPAAEDEYHPN